MHTRPTAVPPLHTRPLRNHSVEPVVGKRSDTSPPLAPPRCWDVADLFGPSNLIEIQHGTERYQLRLTRENRLLLTK